MYKIKIIKPFSEFFDDYLSLESCIENRGFFALLIVFHHLSLKINGDIVFRQFQNIGFLAVAVFFFYSGYGLMKSNLTKANYSTLIFKKRIPNTVIQYVCFGCIYILADVLLNTVPNRSAFIEEILKGNPVVSNSWYIISILIFYFFFGLLILFFKNSRIKIIIGMFIAYLLYVLFLFKLDFEHWWYNSAFSLILGIIWAGYEEKIICIIKKKYHIVFPMIWMIFAVVFYCRNYTKILTAVPDFIISTSLSSLFSVGLVLTNMKIRIGNRITNFLGTISLDIYLIHGLFIKIFHSDKLFINNEILFCLIVIFGSVIFGTAIHFVLKKILNYFNQMMRKNSIK